MIHVNAMGDACPIPVVKTKNAIRELNGPGTVETLVDNEIAVQNLTKMANQKGYGVKSEMLEPGKFRVVMTIGDGVQPDNTPPEEETCLVTPSAGRKNTVVVISSSHMGSEPAGQSAQHHFILQRRCGPDLRRLCQSGGYPLSPGPGSGNSHLRHLPELLWSDGKASGGPGH